ncbi:hypothetical protein Tco_0619966 [Tanacetum coccineum]
MVAYLQKSEGSEGFHQIIDFLNASHIQTDMLEQSDNGEVELIATINEHVKTITEASLFTTIHHEVEDLQIDLQQTEKVYSSALTKLILRVKKLEKQVKKSKARRRVRLVLLEDKDAIQEKISDDTEVLLEEEEHTEIIEDQGSGEKGEKEVSTVGAEHSTVIPEVSTAAENLVFIRRSDEKKIDKGKGIMTEPEPEKKTKNQLEQQRPGHEEDVRLQEQLNKEETQRISRDAGIAKQLQEEYDRAREEQEIVAKDDHKNHVLFWSVLSM